MSATAAPLPPAQPDGWLVIAADGFRSVSKDQASATMWAARCHGVVDALYTLEHARAVIAAETRNTPERPDHAADAK
jgi:hypothetical protein